MRLNPNNTSINDKKLPPLSLVLEKKSAALVFIMLSTVMSFSVFFVSSMMKWICKGTDCFCSFTAFEALWLLNQYFSIFVKIKRLYWWLNYYKIYLQRCDICFLMSDTCWHRSLLLFLLLLLLKSCDPVAVDEVNSYIYAQNWPKEGARVTQQL